MKAIIENVAGKTYFVDTSKPEEFCEILFPDLGWSRSFFVKNKNFVISKDNKQMRAIDLHSTGRVNITPGDLVGMVIWHEK